MIDLSTVWSRYLENRDKLKALKKTLTELYMIVPEYVALNEEKKALSKKMKEIRKVVESGDPDLMAQIEDLKIDVNSDKQMLNDMLLVKMTKGEAIDLRDQYDQPQLPLFSVKFVKVDDPHGE